MGVRLVFAVEATDDKDVRPMDSTDELLCWLLGIKSFAAFGTAELLLLEIFGALSTFEWRRFRMSGCGDSVMSLGLA